MKDKGSDYLIGILLFAGAVCWYFVRPTTASVSVDDYVQLRTRLPSNSYESC